MNDSSNGMAAGNSDMSSNEHDAGDTSEGAFNWESFLARTEELGLDTDEKRAEAAGISLSTYYRMKRRRGRGGNHKLSTIRGMATNLGMPAKELVGQ